MNRIAPITVIAVALVAAVSWTVFSGGTSSGSDAPLSFSDDDLETVVDVDPVDAEAVGIELDQGRTELDLPDDGGASERADVLIRGRVLDSFGKPLVGASVRLEFREGGRARSRQGRALRKPVMTAGDGTFAFQGSGYTRLVITLRVSHERHAPTIHNQTFEEVEGPLDVGDLTLLAGGRLVGQVTDMTGNGVAGATVTLRAEGNNPLRWSRASNQLLPPAETDSRGFYGFEHLMPGAYRPQASAHRMQRGGLRQALDVADGEETEAAPIRLGPGFELTGRVFTADGEPFAGADIQVSPASTAENRRVGRERARSDERGAFAIDHLPGTPLLVQVRAKGHVTWTQDEVDPKLGQPLFVQLDSGLEIRGRVTDAKTSAPVEKFAARYRRIGSLQTESQRANLDRMRAQLEQLRKAARRNPAQLRDLERRVATMQSRSGDPFGNWVRGESARWGRLDGFARSTTRVPTDLGAVSDHPDGTFRFDGLDEGVYVVDVQSPDHQFARSEQITLSRSSGTVEIAMSLSRGLLVAGVVTTSDDEAIGGARVELQEFRETTNPAAATQNPLTRLFPRDDGPRGTMVLTQRSDGNGRFSFPNVPAGSYFVAVRHDRYAAAKSAVFELQADHTAVRVTLRGTGTIEGAVAGIPVGRENDVSVLAFGGFGRTRTERVEPDGSYRIDRLQPGNYMVRAFLGESRSYIGHQMRALFGSGTDSEKLAPDVTLRDGETLQLPLVVDIPPVGRVRGFVTVNGTPTAGLRTSLTPEGEAGNQNRGRFRLRGTPLFNASTDGKGEFEIDDVPPGAYVLAVQSTAADRQELHREPVVVIADVAVERNVAIQTTAVRGTVTSADGSPASELRGSATLIPGMTEVPADLSQLPRGSRGQRMTIRDGQFQSAQVRTGAAMLIVRISRRDPVARPVQLLAGHPNELQIEVGPRKETNAPAGNGR